MGDTSPIKQIEKSVDDLRGIRRRKPWLFYIILAGFVFFAGAWVFEKFWGIPALNKKITDQKEEIQRLESQKDDLVKSNIVVFQIQSATIQSYQIENAKLSRMVGSPEFSLRKRALDLAGQIFDFLKTWRENVPKQTASQEAWLKGNRDDFSRAFMADGEKRTIYSQSMATEFSKKFIGRLSTIRDQLNDLGLKTPKLDYTIDGQIRLDFEIQAATEELQKLAEGIKETSQ